MIARNCKVNTSVGTDGAWKIVTAVSDNETGHTCIRGTVCHRLKQDIPSQ